MPALYLTARFSTPTQRGYLSLEIEAAQPRSAYKVVPGVSQERWCVSEVGAREALDTTVRTIRFMDATGVKPSSAWSSLFGPNAGGMRAGIGPSGFDHTEVWRIDGRYLITTEPYEHGVRAVIDWCFDHGWQARQVPEWGMWNPPGTTLILCSPPTKGIDLERIIAKLAQHEPLPLEHRATAGQLVITSRRPT